MGLSFHYSGKLKNATDIKFLIGDVKDVAKIEKWEYYVFEDQFENNSFSDKIDKENLYGIMVSPLKSEPLCFSFLSNGRICGILNFSHLLMDNDIGQDLLYSVATKTQYSRFENHKKLILLLDHINTKYLENLNCYDEGEYWETRDEELLKRNFEKNMQFIEGFQSSLEMIPINEGENIENYLIRLAEITNKNQK